LQNPAIGIIYDKKFLPVTTHTLRISQRVGFDPAGMRKSGIDVFGFMSIYPDLVQKTEHGRQVHYGNHLSANSQHFRVAGDLERVGDLAKNIAKRSLKIGIEARVPRAIVGLRHMNDVATELMKDVLDACAQRDTERARAVWERDAEIDALEDSVFRDLLTHMMEDPRNISFCAHLLFCSKNVERIGDHATNIAETVFYLVTGETLPGERPKGPHDYDTHPIGTLTP